MRSFFSLTVIVLSIALLIGCPGLEQQRDAVCDPASSACPEGLVCNPVTDGSYRCVGPVVIRGAVIDITDEAPIEDALVQVVDINGAAIGTTGVTTEDGSSVIAVPAMRDEAGNPVGGIYTLRVQAADYIEFPTAIRPALPLDAATAALEGDLWVIENSLTLVALIPFPGDTSTFGSISGRINAVINSGVLVVAEGNDSVLTGYSDGQGNYTIFNVVPGNYSVQGYFAGVQLNPTNTTVQSGEDKTGVNLSQADKPLSSVSGNVQIVNAPGGSVTSVVLAVESTFVEAAGRGKVPPGLRVGGVSGAFAIENVPDGRYVVLAAFENDRLVRDPDQSISGTQVVRITVPDPEQGRTITLADGFKVTEALNIVWPGNDDPEEVDTLTPTLEWEDDSSEDGYEICVFDSFGNEIWRDEIGSVTGSATVGRAYAGPPLEIGMFYQFRATSFRDTSKGRTAISATEDLKGVFFYLQGQ